MPGKSLRSPTSLAAAWQVSPACLCPGFVLPELVARCGEVAAEEQSDLLLRCCETCGSEEGRGSPSFCSTPAPPWRGLSRVLPSPWVGSAGSISLFFSGSVPKHCPGVAQCHCAARSSSAHKQQISLSSRKKQNNLKKAKLLFLFFPKRIKVI